MEILIRLLYYSCFQYVHFNNLKSIHYLSSLSIGALAAFFKSISKFLIEESICFRTFCIDSTLTRAAVSR